MTFRAKIRTKKRMRYDTLGDWPNYDNILVAEMGNEDYELAVGIHELIEAHLCKRNGITPEQVDEFDMKWEVNTEPGDEPEAPYAKEHAAATEVEKAVCKALGIDWDTYDQFLSNFNVTVKE